MGDGRLTPVEKVEERKQEVMIITPPRAHTNTSHQAANRSAPPWPLQMTLPFLIMVRRPPSSGELARISGLYPFEPLPAVATRFTEVVLRRHLAIGSVVPASKSLSGHAFQTLLKVRIQTYECQAAAIGGREGGQKVKVQCPLQWAITLDRWLALGRTRRRSICRRPGRPLSRGSLPPRME